MEEKIKDYAFKLLAMRAYPVGIMHEKLSKKFPEQEKKIASVIARLIEMKYLDDNAYTEMYIRSRNRLKPCGRYRLAQELYKKQIPKEIYQPLLEELDEYELAQKAYEKFTDTLRETDKQKRKEKIMRHLASRGFGYDIISDIIDK